jgi:ubiquinone/menaquinone biosynthesis C-methylase UbiE
MSLAMLSLDDALRGLDLPVHREANSQHQDAKRGTADPEYRRTIAFYRSHLAAVPHSRILDLGAGAGRVSLELAASNGVDELVALDYSLSAMKPLVEDAATQQVFNNLRFCECSTPWQLPFADGRFDVVVCRYALHHFDNQPAALQETARVLSDGGLLLCSDPVMPEHSRQTTHALYKLREESFAGYVTYHEFIDLIVGAGFDIQSARPFAYQRGTFDLYLQAAEPSLRDSLKRAWCGLDDRTKTELKWTGAVDGPFITYPILDLAARKSGRH